MRWRSLKKSSATAASTTANTTDTKNSNTEASNMTFAGAAGGGAFFVAAVVVAVICVCRRRKMNLESETPENDVNPVYATYEIHDDPVAEVRPQFFSIFQTFLRITHFIPWYTTYDLLPPGV